VAPERPIPRAGPAPPHAVQVATILEAAGEAGRELSDACLEIVPRTEHCLVVQATGRAGDVFLCHPFLVHAASWPHRGTTPRWIAQPALDPVEPYDVRERGSR
jgi:hypothetical protein